MEAPLVELDVRGLEPPLPMVKILEALAALPTGATLAVHADGHSALSYSQLEQRGFTYSDAKLPDGTHLTLIRRH